MWTLRFLMALLRPGATGFSTNCESAHKSIDRPQAAQLGHKLFDI
jgi:hypothetical protein